ncbi:MAG: hypothetical protein HUK15_07900, partial [Bacteroidales bacterium]|nr:hypothetical protein [Bacteroidales bacterium]
MKKLSLVISSILSVLCMDAQVVTMTFTGRGIGGDETEEIYQRIDSLQVRNITRHWEEMIYFPDSVYVMHATDVPQISVKPSG